MGFGLPPAPKLSEGGLFARQLAIGLGVTTTTSLLFHPVTLASFVAQHRPHPSPSVLEFMRATVAKDGVASLWRGSLGAMMVRGELGVQLALNDAFNRALARQRLFEEGDPLLRIAAGAATGVAAFVLFYPLELARTRVHQRLTSLRGKRAMPQPRDISLGRQLRAAFVRAGLSGIYSGGSWSLPINTILATGQFGVFKAIQDNNPWGQEVTPKSTLYTMYAACAGRVVVMPLAAPLITMRQLMQGLVKSAPAFGSMSDTRRAIRGHLPAVAACRRSGQQPWTSMLVSPTLAALVT